MICYNDQPLEITSTSAKTSSLLDMLTYETRGRIHVGEKAGLFWLDIPHFETKRHRPRRTYYYPCRHLVATSGTLPVRLSAVHSCGSLSRCLAARSEQPLRCPPVHCRNEEINEQQ